MRHMKTISESSGGVAVVGARRWSTVTQSMSNTSHPSLQNNEENRKISFVLQDQDNESIGSSKNSLCGNVSNMNFTFLNYFLFSKKFHKCPSKNLILHINGKSLIYYFYTIIKMKFWVHIVKACKYLQYIFDLNPIFPNNHYSLEIQLSNAGNTATSGWQNF